MQSALINIEISFEKSQLNTKIQSRFIDFLYIIIINIS